MIRVDWEIEKFRPPIGFILLIIIPASLIILIEIRNIIKELKKQKPKPK